MLRALSLSALLRCGAAHASMTRPFPRNARDGNLSIFKHGAFAQHKVGQHSGCSCTGPEGGCAAGLPTGRSVPGPLLFQPGAVLVLPRGACLALLSSVLRCF